MGKKTISIIVEGGKATAGGAPLGPALAPLGVNLGQIAANINEQTKSFLGLKVPVNITVDIASKDFTIEVGTPPTSELIKKAAGIEKGTGTKDNVGNIEFSALVEIAKSIKSKSQGKTLKEIAKQVAGSSLSMGVSIDSKNGKQIIKEITAGEYNSVLTE